MLIKQSNSYLPNNIPIIINDQIRQCQVAVIYSEWRPIEVWVECTACEALLLFTVNFHDIVGLAIADVLLPVLHDARKECTSSSS